MQELFVYVSIYSHSAVGARAIFCLISSLYFPFSLFILAILSTFLIDFICNIS